MIRRALDSPMLALHQKIFFMVFRSLVRSKIHFEVELVCQNLTQLIYTSINISFVFGSKFSLFKSKNRPLLTFETLKSDL